MDDFAPEDAEPESDEEDVDDDASDFFSPVPEAELDSEPVEPSFGADPFFAEDDFAGSRLSLR